MSNKTTNVWIKDTRAGHRVYTFARNAVSTSELTGPAFSPDGLVLFINIQRDGLTLAITGPWTR